MSLLFAVRGVPCVERVRVRGEQRAGARRTHQTRTRTARSIQHSDSSSAAQLSTIQQEHQHKQ